jgi:hypothetical protein
VSKEFVMGFWIRRLAFFAVLPLCACEDGPKQIYQPAPSGAGDVWNNGNSPSSVGTSGAGFGTQGGGTNRQEICNGAQKAARWAAMVREPIVPPRKAAGLDMAGGDDWHGLTVEEAEQTNCQSDSLGDQFGDGTLVNSWGDNGEVWVQYLVSTRKVLQMTLWPGYVGTIQFKSKDGQHTYEIPVNTQIRKDGQPFMLDWVGNGGANFIAQGDELYRAMLATFAPGLPVDANRTCFDTGRCIKGDFGDVAYFFIPALGFGLWIDNQHAAQPVPSIATRLDLSPAKIMPYAFASPLLKLDAEGPTAQAGKLGMSTTPCTLKMGLTYGDFVNQCVKVTGNDTDNTTEMNKLLGGLSHGTERFSFDVQGVDINFTDRTLPADDIIHDRDRPTDDDIATTFDVDQSTLGNLANDWDAAGTTQDLHGTGAVYKEYARLVREKLLAYKGVPDGDTSKCMFPVPQPTGFDPQAFINRLPAYCTGFEGFITPAPSTGPTDRNNLGPDNAVSLLSGLSLGLKLGHQKVMFCMDANADLTTGYQFCGLDPYGATGDTFSTSFAQVLKIFGRGKLVNLPPDVQDVRFFFKMFSIAFLKYMLYAAAENPVVTDLSTKTLDYDNLFFDSVGAGQFEICEYVDRRFASTTQDPTDFVLGADVRNGIFDSYEFSRDILRGETAIYTATRLNSSHGIGQETPLLTNVFGSPVLQAAYKKSTHGMSGYYCATHIDRDNCDGMLPPLDANGQLEKDENGVPLLQPYQPSFDGAASVFALGKTPVKILQLYPTIQSAMVEIPIHTDPFNLGSRTLPAVDFLVPWLPKQPGVGFPVALSGTLDKFIETAQLDFSGTTISANIDYDFVYDPMTHQPLADGSLQFLAVETTDFLGEVFLCQDPDTQSILHARMYSPVNVLLKWIADHPHATDSCGLIVRYSPYNNYPDYITSLNGGVRLGITQGGGAGRVVDVVLFVPGQ